MRKLYKVFTIQGLNENEVKVSLAVGLLGAAIGGFIGFQFQHFAFLGSPIGSRIIPYALSAGIVSGFLSCFYVSLWFLKIMRNRNWLFALALGWLFGLIAGAITGFITLLVIFFTDWLQMGPFRYADSISDVLTHLGITFMGFIGVALTGLIAGAIIGSVIGLLHSLIFGPWLLEKITKPPGINQSGEIQ